MSESVYDILVSMSVKQLREVCMDHGVNATGNKGELISRLIARSGRA